MAWKRALAQAAHRGGLLPAAGALFGGRRLTVLAYHRVVDHDGPGFDTYGRNVSASPGEFARQMDYAAEHFSPVSLDQVEMALNGGPRLPLRPLLVTFDDGYRDNLTTALPVLHERDIPMVVFLATDFVGSGRAFPWDLAAWCFHHTRQTEACLPAIGHRSWSTPKDRGRVLAGWLEMLKRRPEAERAEAVAALPECLGVNPPPGAFSGLCLSWDEVREMAGEGVAFGAHTERHPILTRVTPDRARQEVSGSKHRIEDEVGVPVTSFAFPNGGRADIDQAAVRLLDESGFRLGFTLIPGPERAGGVGESRLTLRRVYIHHGDYPARFAAKVHGVPRLLGVAR